jgi:p-hydroxybenzoate 3-monooxygenase
MVYGQTEVTRDLMDARAAAGLATIYDAADVTPHDFDGARPWVGYRQDGATHRIDCDFIAGCDGYHGVSRASVPAGALTTFEREYAFGWLGVLSETPPVSHELIYSNHERGFALCSMRSMTRSRYYVQCGLDERVEAWSDDAFWAELRAGSTRKRRPRSSPGRRSRRASRRCAASSPSRCASAASSSPATPPTSCRRRVPRVSTSPPPTSACWRARWPSTTPRRATPASTRTRRAACAASGAPSAFSWWFTSLMHHFPETGAFGRKMQAAELDYLVHSVAASTALAENYVGLPLEG